MAERVYPFPANSGAERGLARLGLYLADWSEKWFPDAFVFALLAVALVAVAAIAIGAPVS